MNHADLVDRMTIFRCGFKADVRGRETGLLVQTVTEAVDDAQNFDLTVGVELDFKRNVALDMKLARLRGVLR